MRSGGVIAYPTEAVYGIGCLPLSAGAVARVLRLKHRHAAKGFVLVAADMPQVEAFAMIPGGKIGAEIAATWPGPVTWILPARRHVPSSITGGRATVAIRMTAHPVARALCLAAGSALVSTSANLSGRQPITRKTTLRSQLGRMVDMIVPGDLGQRAKPTAIRDAGTGSLIRAD